MLRIATWNVNSLRIRGDILTRFITQWAPDVLCLQETKVADELFPHDLVRALGFEHCANAGQKSYNGVAILSKLPLSDTHTLDLLGNGEKRHLSARLPTGMVIHNFYVPAGGDIPDPATNPKFKDKLAFVAAMTRWSRDSVDTKAPVVALGDFNIAPQEHDVWSHKQLLDVVSHTPVEVEALSRLQVAADWVDSGRHNVPASEKIYSWWSYRNRDWKASNRGRRLDHIWLTPPLAPHIRKVHHIADTRDWESTSDHVPVLLELA